MSSPHVGPTSAIGLDMNTCPKLVEVSRGAQINRLCLAYPAGLGA